MAVDEPLAVRRPKQGSQRAWPQGRATTGSLVSRQTGQLALAKTRLPQAFSWVLRQLGQVIMLLFFACHVGVQAAIVQRDADGQPNALRSVRVFPSGCGSQTRKPNVVHPLDRSPDGCGCERGTFTTKFCTARGRQTEEHRPMQPRDEAAEQTIASWLLT